ncbi:MAG: Era-like GTP-binding protein [Candidatus Methanodesulfokora sp.]|nr:MAG: GTP-binding protein [Candidatus Korarchaeota archaeon]
MTMKSVEVQKRGISGIIRRLLSIFSKKKKVVLGIYGPVNSGKTTLANKISRDFAGISVGSVSRIPHETRRIQCVENVEIRVPGGGKLLMDIIDTPGIATKVSYRTFLRYGMKKEEAVERAREAALGVIEAIKSLDRVDIALLVVDSTKDPTSQVNFVIAGNLKFRGIPYIVVANKIDLPYSKPESVEKSFPEDIVVPISALTGENIELLYEKIYEVARR